MDWKDYQERAADFFRSLGLEAETDVKIQGVRTSHDVDVLVRSYHAGFHVTWIVECKHWNSKVSKVHVLALREIVNDAGADRGILLAENGFQSGALEAASLTNVQLTSLADVQKSASTAVHSMKLRDLFDRLNHCRNRYWDIPKDIRIRYGLRPESGGGVGYSGDSASKVGEALIAKGFRGEFPIQVDDLDPLIFPSKALLGQSIPEKFDAMIDLLLFLTPLVETLEDKLDKCKSTVQ